MKSGNMAKSLRKGFKRFGIGVKHNSDKILTGAGLALGATTVVLAVKATPQALLEIEDAKFAKEQDGGTFTKMDAVKVAYRHYIPAVCTGMAAGICIIVSDVIDAKKIAGMAAAAAETATAFEAFKKATAEVTSEGKVDKIRDKVAQNQLAENPQVPGSEVYITSDKDVLCYDSYSGRYFKSTYDKLKHAENELNAKIIDEMYASLNDFWYEVGLTGTSMGENLGFNEKADLYLSAQLAEDNQPCIVVSFRVDPRVDFRTLM